MRHFICLSVLLLACGAASAQQVALIGVSGNKAAILAIDGGDPVRMEKARGSPRPRSVKRATVTGASIEQRGIDGVDRQQGPGVALLDRRFLKRLAMKRDGDTMTLTRRF